MKKLALDVRKTHDLAGPRVMISDLKRIMKLEGIEFIHYGDLKLVRGLYVNDPIGIEVLVNRNLPRDPKAFTLAHELKHHLVDSSLGMLSCNDNNISEMVEIGAEVFAAELLFPEELFLSMFDAENINTREDLIRAIVRLKTTTDTTLSYTGIVKRVEYFGLNKRISLGEIAWKSAERRINGTPNWKKIRKTSI